MPQLDAGADRFVLWVATDAPVDEVRVACADFECPVLSRSTRPGSPQGVVAVVIDDSGSNKADPSTCTGCPTDADGGRIGATKAFFSRLLEPSPGWRAALFDFGPPPNGGFNSTRFIAGYSSVPDDLLLGCDRLAASGGTFVYDAISEVSPTIAGERLGLDGGSDAPAHLLLVTDGEDTNSVVSLPHAVSETAKLGVTVDSIGYGHSDGGPIPLLAGKAFRDLRLIASATQGFSSIGQTEQLRDTLTAVADAYLYGVVQVELALPAGTSHASGTVSVRGTQLPFAF